MSPQDLHRSLLRPAILHILRAQGFHSTRPSVLDALTDLASRHMHLLAQTTSQAVLARTQEACTTAPFDSSSSPSSPTTLPTPTVHDILTAFHAAHVFPTAAPSVDESWRARLRPPLSSYPAGARRERELARRNAEDTAAVRAFVEWCAGDAAREIRRIAGLLSEDSDTIAPGETGDAPQEATATAPATAGDERKKRARKEDYLALLKKKHSKTGDEARYAGTTLASHPLPPPPSVTPAADAAPSTQQQRESAVKIDGGPESLAAWRAGVTGRKPASLPAPGRASAGEDVGVRNPRASAPVGPAQQSRRSLVVTLKLRPAALAAAVAAWK